MILKLHAFDDRKAREDSDFGRHHALDILGTIVRMDEKDWENAKAHRAAQSGEVYLKRAAEIQKNNFSKPTDPGLLRLRENESYRSNRQVLDAHLEPFIQDLSELFSL